MNSTQQTVLDRYFGKIDPKYAGTELIVSKVCVLQYKGQWRDVEIEGTLYIYRRGPAGPFRLAIPDRRKLQRFTLDVASGTALDSHGRLLILSDHASASHYGLWFTAEGEASRVCSLLNA